jgi:hypothetical protein
VGATASLLASGKNGLQTAPNKDEAAKRKESSGNANEIIQDQTAGLAKIER